MPKCLVCQTDTSIHSLILKTTGGDIKYFRCPDCSLVFQDPTADFSAEEIYNADYIHKRSQDPENLTISKPREKTAEYYYEWVKKFAPKGNLLEIGCATGIALKVAQQKGWKVFGVEVNPEAARIANGVLNVDVVRTGFLSPAMFPDQTFSLVTLFDVIEHIPNPVEFISIIHQLTAPGGHILFVTPDIDTLSFKLLKNKWPHFVQEHLALFSPKSMDKLLTATGFRTKTHGWARKYLSLGMLKTHAEHHPNRSLYGPISRILGTFPAISQSAFPFNLGEMYLLAEKI